MTKPLVVPAWRDAAQPGKGPLQDLADGGDEEADAQGEEHGDPKIAKEPVRKVEEGEDLSAHEHEEREAHHQPGDDGHRPLEQLPAGELPRRLDHDRRGASCFVLRWLRGVVLGQGERLTGGPGEEHHRQHRQDARGDPGDHPGEEGNEDQHEREQRSGSTIVPERTVENVNSVVGHETAGLLSARPNVLC